MMQLAFFSTATAVDPVSDLEFLLLTSRRNNLRLEITGMLIHSKGNFLQILEGPRDAVLTRFDVIQQDRRHTGVTEIFQRLIARRDFPDQPMAFHDLRSRGSAIAGYAEFLQEHFDLGALQPSGASALFQLLKDNGARETAAS